MRSFYLLAAALLTGCATSAPDPVPAAQLFTAAGLATDSTPGAPVLVLNGKYKGPVNITVQAGAGNTAGQTAIDKAKGPVASAPGAVATATKEAGTAWYWFVLAAVAGAVVWEYVSQQFSFTKWLPWRRLQL